MNASISRRGFLAGMGAVPFLRIPGARAAANDMVTFGLSSFPPNLSPWTQSGTAAGTVKLLIHRGLFSYGTDGEIHGELAESWTNDSPTTWVIKLRDALFHDGSPVTSADVAWCVEQIAAEEVDGLLPCRPADHRQGRNAGRPHHPLHHP